MLLMLAPNDVRPWFVVGTSILLLVVRYAAGTLPSRTSGGQHRVGMPFLLLVLPPFFVASWGTIAYSE